MNSKKRILKIVIVCSAIGILTSSCFKKGSGKGSRKIKGDGTSVGDVFVPGPGNKPGTPKPGINSDTMDPEARKILAACFGISVEEVADVVGWTDPAQSAEAANKLCASLATVNFNKGVVDVTAEQVEID